MRIKSDGTFFAGLGGTPLFVAPGIRSLPRVRSGLGDITLGAAYALPNPEARGFDLEVSGRVKLPTASDSSQLSTGKADYSVGADVSKTMGRITPNLSATYRTYGDTRLWQFRNGFDVMAGVAYAVTPKSAVIVSYEYVQAASRFIGDSHEIVVGTSLPVGGDRFRLSGYGAAGLSRSAADVSGGISLSATL